MITELDQRYVVLKCNDIHLALTGEEMLALDDMIDKIQRFRVKNLRPPYKNYVVVSESMCCYELVKQTVLDELNEPE